MYDNLISEETTNQEAETMKGELKEINGEKIYFISQDEFIIKYTAHQNWLKKYHAELENIDIDFQESYLNELDSSEEDCIRYTHYKYSEISCFLKCQDCEELGKQLNDFQNSMCSKCISCTYSYKNVTFPQNLDLSWAIMPKADLKNCNMGDCNLSQASLVLSDCRGINLSLSNINGANLSNINLNEANLSGANIQGTNLSLANMNNANLSFADLSGSQLNGANLENAVLVETKIEKANLTNVKLAYIPELATYNNSVVTSPYENISFKHSILKNVNLRHINEITAQQIAGADLSGTKLPVNLTDMRHILDPANASIKSAGAISTATLIISTLIFLLCLSVDVSLYETNGYNTPVFLNFTKGMMWILPLSLSMMYLNTQIKLSSFWSILENMPAIFTDGRRLPDMIDPWIATSWLYELFPRLKDDKNYKKDSLNIIIQNLFSFIMLYLSLPALIIFICTHFDMYILDIPTTPQAGNIFIFSFITIAIACVVITFIIFKKFKLSPLKLGCTSSSIIFLGILTISIILSGIVYTIGISITLPDKIHSTNFFISWISTLGSLFTLGFYNPLIKEFISRVFHSLKTNK